MRPQALRTGCLPPFSGKRWAGRGGDKEGNLGWEHRGENAKTFTQLQCLFAGELCLEKPHYPPTNRSGTCVAGSDSAVGPLCLEQACPEVEAGEDPGSLAGAPPPAPPPVLLSPPQPDTSTRAGADWALPAFCPLLPATLQYNMIVTPPDRSVS